MIAEVNDPLSSLQELHDANVLRLDRSSPQDELAFVHPLDVTAVVRAATETRGIVTAEEGTLSGGLGAAVASVVAEHRPAPMRLLGIPGVFAPTGSTTFLLEHFGLTADGIAAAARDILARGSYAA